ncbi:hypothetical protein [Priestia megaterium]|uniref:hypothetical protein n=1 Tax=Priestia megaterium TaxID=1404 RepID=UPI0020A447AB|nr:hypothetical protein [Priestia megaterium]
MSEEKVKQKISSLKSELAFYKEEYQKFKHQEFEYEDMKEELAELKEKHEQEKRKLQEKIDWLKACVNEQKSKNEQSIVQYDDHDHARETIQELESRLGEVTEQERWKHQEQGNQKAAPIYFCLCSVKWTNKRERLSLVLNIML